MHHEEADAPGEQAALVRLGQAVEKRVEADLVDERLWHRPAQDRLARLLVVLGFVVGSQPTALQRARSGRVAHEEVRLFELGLETHEDLADLCPMSGQRPRLLDGEEGPDRR